MIRKIILALSGAALALGAATACAQPAASPQCQKVLAEYEKAITPVQLSGAYAAQMGKTIPLDAPLAAWALGWMQQQSCPDTPG